MKEGKREWEERVGREWKERGRERKWEERVGRESGKRKREERVGREWEDSQSLHATTKLTQNNKKRSPFCVSIYFSMPAIPRAPAGSNTERVSLNAVLIAAHISSVETVII